MTLICEEVIDQAAGVLVTRRAEELINIYEPDCAAAILERRLMPEFQDWLNQLKPEQLPKGRLILRAEDVEDAVTQLCEIAEIPSCDFLHLFINDVVALSQLFASIMKSKYIRLRLDVIKDNACRKFHKDAITARLICTYRGPGTEYGTALVGNDPEQIYSASIGAPVILRGTQWPEQPASGLLHRSPPIEGTPQTRLVLVIDPVADPASDI